MNFHLQKNLPGVRTCIKLKQKINAPESPVQAKCSQKLSTEKRRIQLGDHII